MSPALTFRIAGVAAALAGAGAAAVCAGPATAPSRHELAVAALRFPDPPSGIRAGDTIVWINRDLVPHTVEAADGGWSSGEIAPGGSFIWVAGPAGAVRYVCGYHPTMTGTLTIR